MNYTHKIYNIGNGLPSAREIITDDEKDFFECISISEIHTGSEPNKTEWVYALCEYENFEYEDFEYEFKDIKRIYDMQEIKGE